MPRLLEAASAAFRRAVYVSCCAPATGQTVAQMMGGSVHGASPDEVGWPADPAQGFDALFPLMFCNDMSHEQQRAFLAKLGDDEWPAACAAESGWRYGRTPQLPATYVGCLDDGSLPVPWQARFAERFGAQIRVDIQAGHQVMNTRPQTLAEVLRLEASRGA
jgi:pimeloyl-ACP methyl ester carboxylesterase